MTKKACLILENGMIFEGLHFGAEREVTGELVFTTGMTGYLETLTDKSYHGQIILQTFPLIGNYGVIPPDFESDSPGACGYIVKSWCRDPSNFRSEGNLDTFLLSAKIPGIYGIDTRALTKIIRVSGVMNGAITCTDPRRSGAGLPTLIENIKSYRITGAVAAVSTRETKFYKSDQSNYRVVLFDFGSKHNIRRVLLQKGCDVIVVPHDFDAGGIRELSPDGIMLSNGPGDPAENIGIISNLRSIIQLGIPIFGICLGHQLLALAAGFSTQKMKYGHRGANQPVKDLLTGKVYITSQNHGYTVVTETIAAETAIRYFENVYDKTCEGLIYRDYPVFSVQFHPEACAGPLDTEFLFDRFIQYMQSASAGSAGCARSLVSTISALRPEPDHAENFDSSGGLRICL
ncbi:MAG: carbamoyl phosphate synthase small subunit [Eubacteriales bacterium]|nr:carbamoyl phosphate synthase small subunit [Eubacteriales bacterium]